MHHKSKLADGRYLGKIKKSPYLGRGSSDVDEIWHGDAFRRSWPSRLIVRSFVLSGQASSLFWTPALRQPRESRGVDWCVWCARHVGWRRESKTVTNLKFQKSKIAAAAILKNRQIAVYRLRFDQSARNLAWLRTLALRTEPAIEISNF